MKIPLTRYLLVLALCLHTNVWAGQKPVSGYEFLSDQIKEILDDDFLNPGMETVEHGRLIFNDFE